MMNVIFAMDLKLADVKLGLIESTNPGSLHKPSNSEDIVLL
jgi:hypothetical protein